MLIVIIIVCIMYFHLTGNFAYIISQYVFTQLNNLIRNMESNEVPFKKEKSDKGAPEKTSCCIC